MTSTDPAIQAVYKKHKAAIDAAAANEYNLKMLQATPSTTSNDKILDLVKTYQNQAINAKNTGDLQ